MSKSSNESVSEQKKLDVTKWFESLRDQICISFETLETNISESPGLLSVYLNFTRFF